jgi:hypothetical protein
VGESRQNDRNVALSSHFKHGSTAPPQGSKETVRDRLGFTNPVERRVGEDGIEVRIIGKATGTHDGKGDRWIVSGCLANHLGGGINPGDVASDRGDLFRQLSCAAAEVEYAIVGIGYDGRPFLDTCIS